LSVALCLYIPVLLEGSIESLGLRVVVRDTGVVVLRFVTELCCKLCVLLDFGHDNMPLFCCEVIAKLLAHAILPPPTAQHKAALTEAPVTMATFPDMLDYSRDERVFPGGYLRHGHIAKRM